MDSSGKSGTQLLDPGLLKKLAGLVIHSRKVFTGRIRGDRPSKKRGQSIEFADYKDYSQGDDLRFIDWNAYGRLDRLFMKLFMEEEDLHVHVLVDASGSMAFGTPPKIDVARKLAAAIAFVALAGGDRVSVTGFSSDLVYRFPAVRGRKNIWGMFDFMAKLEPRGTTSVAQSLKNFSMRHPGKGVAVVLSDFLDKSGWREGLKFLAMGNMDVTLLHVMADEEITPDVTGDLLLVDAEDGEELDFSVSSSAMKDYGRNVDAHRAELRDYCVARGFSCLFVPTSFDMERFVLHTLRKSGFFK
jgi:uncharacterized protein (DUF58 family)